jgi:hypothetical protein
MGKVYKIEQIKLFESFKKFQKDGTFDKHIIQYMDQHSITKQRFYEYFSNLPRNEVKKYYKILVSAFQYYIKDSSEIDLQLRYDLEDVYYTITNNLKTSNEKYKLPVILKKYHKNINPVRSIYFEIQEIDINFNKKNEDHMAVIKLIKDKKFIDNLVQDIKQDIKSLQSLEKRFYEMKKLYKFFTFPMTFYHTQEMIKDMKKWNGIFLRFYAKYNDKNYKYD